MAEERSRTLDAELEARDWTFLRAIRDKDLDVRNRREAGMGLISNYDPLIGAIVSREIFKSERQSGRQFPNREDHIAEAKQEARVRIWREAKIDRSYDVPFRVVVTNQVRWAVHDYLAVILSAPNSTGDVVEILDHQPSADDFDPHETRTIFLEWLDEQGEPNVTIARRCWLHGHSSKSVAEAVGLSVGAVNTRKSRMAEDLRGRFEA